MFSSTDAHKVTRGPLRTAFATPTSVRLSSSSIDAPCECEPCVPGRHGRDAPPFELYTLPCTVAIPLLHKYNPQISTVEDMYELGEVLGEGVAGVVRIAQHRET